MPQTFTIYGGPDHGHTITPLTQALEDKSEVSLGPIDPELRKMVTRRYSVEKDKLHFIDTVDMVTYYSGPVDGAFMPAYSAGPDGMHSLILLKNKTVAARYRRVGERMEFVDTKTMAEYDALAKAGKLLGDGGPDGEIEAAGGGA